VDSSFIVTPKFVMERSKPEGCGWKQLPTCYLFTCGCKADMHFRTECAQSRHIPLTTSRGR